MRVDESCFVSHLLSDACDNEHRAIGSELNSRTFAQLGGSFELLPVEKRAVGGTGICDEPAAVLQTKLGVLPRDHRPVFLMEDDLARRGVAPHHEEWLLIPGFV